MTVVVDGASVRAVTQGILLENTAAVPASGASADLFTVDTGSVLLVGFYGDVELKIPLGGVAIDVEVGYESTGTIDIEGTATLEGEALGIPFEDDWDVEGALDFSGPYVAVSLEFPF